MGNKKVKINIIFIVIVILLIITALMIRFEINPISYFIGGDKDKDVIADSEVNYNGIYRYRESLKDVYRVFNGCTVSYFDYYIVILNDDYYRYKSSCIGTFLLDEGKVKNLKIEENLDKNKYIVFDGKQYDKNDLLTEVRAINAVKENEKKAYTVSLENYHFLFQQMQVPGNYFSIAKGVLRSGNASFRFNFSVLENNHFKITVMNNKIPLYSYTVDDLSRLPLFRGMGETFSTIEPITNGDSYAYKFKVYNKTSLVYDLSTKFPITVDGVTLNYSDNIYIKFSTSLNAYVLLISKNEKLCEKKENSTDIAYYVFYIKYNYVNKSFDNPKFIDKVYQNEGCSYVKELMEA